MVPLALGAAPRHNAASLEDEAADGDRAAGVEEVTAGTRAGDADGIDRAMPRCYTVRSEWALVERIDTDLLFRWFCGLDPAEPGSQRGSPEHPAKRHPCLADGVTYVVAVDIGAVRVSEADGTCECTAALACSTTWIDAKASTPRRSVPTGATTAGRG